ncbi:S-layer homology domain-containing protein [Paenibacillus sp. H1-7]|uniref:S-layer homology domain-containing protein n=1 Tax=Paenibacillus sp. H1-7 TaxID=2282849 RepID=UPI001EF908BB|nr:S-layer homology domain-containing protein [Paenibacillus sp. H1-7]ULL17941.1 S-layer homology domain-containing protein [Paenibacillus sp. H1-7]
MNRIKKLALSMIVSAVVVPIAYQHNANASGLQDITDHWGRTQIEAAVKEGYVDGYPDGTFRPDQQVSRAEFLKLVVDALKFAKNGQAVEWYQPYVDAAVANGLHVADEFPSDRLNDPMTREEMARIAVRATGQANYDAKKWMYLATSKGIITGMDSSGTLGPEQPTTRAQAVTVIRRIMKIREGASLPTDKYAVSSAEVYWHKTNVFTMLPRYFTKVRKDERFRDEMLTSSAWDGNVTCSVDQYVVVDMDDPNDPNRSLVPGDLKVFEQTGTREISGSNYVLVSKQTTRIKYFPANTPKIAGCYIAIIDMLFDDTGKLKSEGQAYQTAPLGAYIENTKEQKYSNRIKGEEGTEVIKTTYSYEILPKAPLTSKNTSPDIFRIGFYGVDAFSPKVVYDGIINKEFKD